MPYVIAFTQWAGCDIIVYKINVKVNMKKSSYILIFGIAALVIGSGVALFVFGGGTGPKKDVAGVQTVAEGDWVKGNKEADVSLIEYGDFQCPACGDMEPLLAQVNQEFSGKIKFVYRNYPLPMHKNAKQAAYAAEAAGKQGKFWEMHDLLFQNQESWSELPNPQEKFVSFATVLGLNLDQFGADMNSSEIKFSVEADFTSGEQAGVNSTPTFFLNGEKIRPKTPEEFKGLIQKELNR